MKKNQDKQIRRDYDTARRAIEALLMYFVCLALQILFC